MGKPPGGTTSIGPNPSYVKPLLCANENGTADERYLYDSWEAMEEVAAKGCPPKYEIEANVQFLQDPQNWNRIANLLWEEAAHRNLRDASFKEIVARKKAMSMIDDLWEGNREQWLPRLANYKLPDGFVNAAKQMVYFAPKKKKIRQAQDGQDGGKSKGSAGGTRRCCCCSQESKSQGRGSCILENPHGGSEANSTSSSCA